MGMGLGVFFVLKRGIMLKAPETGLNSPQGLKPSVSLAKHSFCK